jgi:hypothetical protein
MIRSNIAASVISVVLLAFHAGPAQADLISGNFGGASALSSTGTPGEFEQKFVGVGEDDVLGLFAIESESLVDFSDPPNLFIHDGMVTLFFANGSLFGTSSGMGVGSGMGTAVFELDLIFTGGTGIFAGATGEVSIMGTIVRTSPTTESIAASYAGRLNLVPEPSSLSLLGLGAAAGAGVLVRTRRRPRRSNQH